MLIPTIQKEILLLKRDPRVLVRLIAMPVVFIALFGMVFKGGGPKITSRPLAVYVDPARVEVGGRITTALEHSKLYRVLAQPTRDAVFSTVKAEKADAGLVIGADFDPMHGKRGTLVIDPTGSPQETGPLRGAINAIVDEVVEGRGPPTPMLDEMAPSNEVVEEATAFQLTVPGNAVLFGFFIALTCALSFAEERNTGTWRRLLASPVSRWQLLVAKLVPYIALGTLQVGLLFTIGAVGFGMKIAGSLPALAVLTVGVACAATTLGLLIAAVSTTEKQISSLGSILILIMGLVGGCMIPRMLMPHSVQTVGLFVPHGWALDGYHTLLVRHGTGFADVWRQILAVYGFAAGFALLGIRRFKFDR